MRTSTLPEARRSEQNHLRTLYALGREHGLPLVIYGLCSLIFTWPTVQNFTTRLVSVGSEDPRHNVWLLWHVREVLLGNQSLFNAELIYYPHGISLLTHGLGPVMGFFAFPFWPWGVEAAHNGAVLVGFGLTGYFMYLLARSLGFRREISLFAGMMLLLAPMHLGGLYGHMTKVFLGLIPLSFLALGHALDPRRSPFWTVGAALALLFTLLHHGQQFIFVALAIPFFMAFAWWQAVPGQRRPLAMRCMLLGISILLIVGPLLLAILRAGSDPRIVTVTKLESLRHRPDVAELVLPPEHSRLFGSLTSTFLKSHGVLPTLETAVFFSWVGLTLSSVAYFKKRKAVSVWLALTLFFTVLALGPSLQVLGQDSFTDFELPIVLPFAFITELPGLGVIRTPGRFMMLGAVTFAVAASYGLAWLVQRFPKYSQVILALVIGLLLIENWPRPWPQETLRPIPDFYRQIAADGEMYGVLDLPTRPTLDSNPITYAAHYQVYQTVHGKGITTAYISRPYVEHPLFPCLIPDFGPAAEILFVNGEPSKCYANILDDLAGANYRYVIWHAPKADYLEYRPGSWGEQASAQFIYQVFGEQAPITEDDLVSVYAIPGSVPVEDLTTALNLVENWYPFSPARGYRWARSPATLSVTSPETQPAVLEITPAAIHVKGAGAPLGEKGQLRITMADFDATITIESNKTTAVPLIIPAGRHIITLELEAGNFRSRDSGETQLLSFAIRSINLQVQE